MAISNLTLSEFNATVNACMARVDVKKADWSIAQTEIDIVNPFLTDWKTKYDATQNKKMASAADREARDLARQALEPVFSMFIEKNIYLNSAMNDADIVSCNLEPRKKTHTPAGKPATIPQMEYKQGQSHTLAAYYRQEPGASGVSRRGKPKGVGRCEIAYFIEEKESGAAAAASGSDDNPFTANPNDFPKRIDGTKNPVSLAFLPADAGKYVVLAARWIGTGNIPGDWGQIEVMMIP